MFCVNQLRYQSDFFLFNCSMRTYADVWGLIFSICSTASCSDLHEFTAKGEIARKFHIQPHITAYSNRVKYCYHLLLSYICMQLNIASVFECISLLVSAMVSSCIVTPVESNEQRRTVIKRSQGLLYSNFSSVVHSSVGKKN